MDMKLSRRNMIRSALGISGALALSDLLRVAKAESTVPLYPDRYFVFAVFSGGWDPQLALDPKDPSIYNDSTSTIDETGVETGYSKLGLGADPRVFGTVENMVFGPYIGELHEFSPRISLIRGMAMSSVSHQTATRHALTARVPAGNSVRGSSVATILASVLGENEPIPNLVAQVETFNIHHPLWCSGLRTSNITDLRDSLSPGISLLEDAERDALERFFVKEESRIQSRRIRSILESRLTSRNLINENIADLFNTSNGDLQWSRFAEDWQDTLQCIGWAPPCPSWPQPPGRISAAPSRQREPLRSLVVVGQSAPRAEALAARSGHLRRPQSPAAG